MMKRIITSLVLLSLIMMVFLSGSALAATPPDIIHNYTVNIDPQLDGTLLMKYDFDYEATTDFPTNIQYLEVGVPNKDFKIVDFGPIDFVKNAKAITSGTSQVHLDFYKLPKKGDRFKLNFTIKQSSMAYKTDENICFKFIPGWFDFATIRELKVIVKLDDLKVQKFEPETGTKNDKEIIWITNNLKVNEKADAMVVISSKSSYPQLKEDKLVNEPDSSGMSAGMIIFIIFLVIIVIVVIIGAVSDGYGGGGFIGGFGDGSSGSSGGGDGGFSGRGSSCACVSSCACACACAGGGRVGCAERGHIILRWFVDHQKNAEEGEKSD